MGLLSAPIRGLLWVFQEVADRAEEELYGDEPVKAELTELYLGLEAGTVSEEQFEQREAELVQRLEEIEQRRLHRSGRERR
jgi:hypothetical protein